MFHLHFFISDVFAGLKPIFTVVFLSMKIWQERGEHHRSGCEGKNWFYYPQLAQIAGQSCPGGGLEETQNIMMVFYSLGIIRHCHLTSLCRVLEVGTQLNYSPPPHRHLPADSLPKWNCCSSALVWRGSLPLCRCRLVG